MAYDLDPAAEGSLDSTTLARLMAARRKALILDHWKQHNLGDDSASAPDLGVLHTTTGGPDALLGGPGADTADYTGAAKRVVVDLAAGEGYGGAKGDSYTDIENVVGSAFNDVLKGDDGDNLLDGGAGNDILQGWGGDDWLRGGAGADTLDGGDGVDTADYAGTAKRVVVDLGRGIGAGGAKGDVLRNIENVVGTDYNDVLKGNASDNRLVGGAGNDILKGFGGDDILVGGAGADTMEGGDGMDTVDYSGADRRIVLNLETGAGAGGAKGDVVSQVENVVGSRYNDVVKGSAADNILAGGAGNDILKSYGGNDILIGGEGADTMNGGDGVDAADYRDTDRRVVVDLETGAGAWGAKGDMLSNIENLYGTAFNDVLKGDAADNMFSGGDGDDILQGRGGNDILFGGAGADVLSGGQGDDLLVSESGDSTLKGGAGNDTLVAGDGDDVLIGGAGADVFQFLPKDDGTNYVWTIKDFEAGADVLRVGTVENADFAASAGTMWDQLDIFPGTPDTGKYRLTTGDEIIIEGSDWPLFA